MGLEINEIKAVASTEKKLPPTPVENKNSEVNNSSIITANTREEAPLNLSHALASLGSNPDQVFDYLKNALKDSDKPEVDLAWMQYAEATPV